MHMHGVPLNNDDSLFDGEHKFNIIITTSMQVFITFDNDSSKSVQWRIFCFIHDCSKFLALHGKKWDLYRPLVLN